VGKRLYVGNLSYRVTSEDLAELFAGSGTVEKAEVVSDRATGRSKGFGFVEMSTNEEALAAIEALHGKDNQGRPLTVNEARPKEIRPSGSGDRRRDW
jgi:cold-inducible RNA-binding protein